MGSLKTHGQKQAITVMNRDAYIKANPEREADLEPDTSHVVIDGSSRLPPPPAKHNSRPSRSWSAMTRAPTPRNSSNPLSSPTSTDRTWGNSTKHEPSSAS